jgi:carbon storage regulator CsrA
MLVLERKRGMSIMVGESVVKVVSIRRNSITLAIDAPPSIRIVRCESIGNATATNERKENSTS